MYQLSIENIFSLKHNFTILVVKNKSCNSGWWKRNQVKKITKKTKTSFEFRNIPFLQLQLNHFSKYNFSKFLFCWL